MGWWHLKKKVSPECMNESCLKLSIYKEILYWKQFIKIRSCGFLKKKNWKFDFLNKIPTKHSIFMIFCYWFTSTLQPYQPWHSFMPNFLKSVLAHCVPLIVYISKKHIKSKNTKREEPVYFFFPFCWFAPRGGVTGRLEFNPPYGNFFLSAGWKKI